MKRGCRIHHLARVRVKTPSDEREKKSTPYPLPVVIRGLIETLDYLSLEKLLIYLHCFIKFNGFFPQTISVRTLTGFWFRLVRCVITIMIPHPQKKIFFQRFRAMYANELNYFTVSDRNKNKNVFPYRELNPGLPGESRVS